jgi:hypothetical protein
LLIYGEHIAAKGEMHVQDEEVNVAVINRVPQARQLATNSEIFAF